jgi:hypothetical protein
MLTKLIQHREVIDAVRDPDAWRAVLKKLPPSTADIYFQPEYALLHCGSSEARALLFTYERGPFVWAYPFLIKPIRYVGRERVSEPLFDIETPYGYGGPISNSSDASFLREANEEFKKWCDRNDVISEFVSTHPIVETWRWLSPDMDVRLNRWTVSLALPQLANLELARWPFTSNAIYMVRRAKRAGVRVRTYGTDYWDRFVHLYRNTMDRVGAAPFYYFDDNYFNRLRELIRCSGRLVAAEVDGRWVAAACFLAGENYLHYHLSASDHEHHVPGATNALIYEVAKSATSQGFKAIHFGGGRTPNSGDSLLKFKRRLGTHTHPHFLGQRVHRPETYYRLHRMWCDAHPDLVAKSQDQILCYRQG